MPTQKNLKLASCLLSCFFLCTTNSLGQLIEIPPFWTHVASACSVDESALSKYAFNLADFGFATGKVSDIGGFGLPIPIFARCNVLNPLDTGDPLWNTLIVGYQDPDGTAPKYQVLVRLRRVSRSTGGISTMATFNSNLTTLTTRGERSVNVAGPFDFLHNEYFVEIGVARTDTLGNPIVYMVRLERTVLITAQVK
jgi:hypothetical protein